MKMTKTDIETLDALNRIVEADPSYAQPEQPSKAVSDEKPATDDELSISLKKRLATAITLLADGISVTTVSEVTNIPADFLIQHGFATNVEKDYIIPIEWTEHGFLKVRGLSAEDALKNAVAYINQDTEESCIPTDTAPVTDTIVLNDNVKIIQIYTDAFEKNTLALQPKSTTISAELNDKPIQYVHEILQYEPETTAQAPVAATEEETSKESDETVSSNESNTNSESTAEHESTSIKETAETAAVAETETNKIDADAAPSDTELKSNDKPSDTEPIGAPSILPDAVKNSMLSTEPVEADIEDSVEHEKPAVTNTETGLKTESLDDDDSKESDSDNIEPKTVKYDDIVFDEQEK